MSGRYSSFSKRLDKIEENLAKQKRLRKTASSLLPHFIANLNSEIFEEEIYQPGPTDGYRRLGQLLVRSFCRPSESLRRLGKDPVEMEKFVAAYKLALEKDTAVRYRGRILIQKKPELALYRPN